MNKIIVGIVVSFLSINTMGQNPKGYTAESWWLGPHLDKYSEAEQTSRLQGKVLASADDQEQVVILAADVRSIIKDGPGFLGIYTKALKNEPIETLARTTLNLGAWVVSAVAVAEVADCFGADINALDQITGERKKDKERKRAQATDSRPPEDRGDSTSNDSGEQTFTKVVCDDCEINITASLEIK